MLANAIGSANSPSMTVPVILPVCANDINETKNKKQRREYIFFSIIGII
jgi:hypothetical protein